MRTSLLALLIAVTLSTGALAGELRAYLDRKSVYEGDTVTLVIETTGGALEQPDLSGLGTDFDLLGTSQSTNISIVNGERTDTIRLLVSLAPRRTGTIQVPPIQVGSEKTDPLVLKVEQVPETGSGGGGDDIFVEMEVETDAGELLVQQQAGLRVRLFTAVPLSEGKLEDPRAEGALVTKLGEDRQFETNRNGRDYRVIERRYSLSPERSGDLRIPPVRFEGRLRTGGSGRGGSRSLFNDPFFDRFFQGSPLSRDPFGMLDHGKPVSARSPGIALEVKARPDDYTGAHWLPAEELVILDSWTESPPEPEIGEPISRTLTLQAKGLSGPQIPRVEIPETAGLRIYPEKSSDESRSDGETVYGISRQELTLIPTRTGAIEIPEIQVSWWDTVAQQERTTSVPGWTLEVSGEASAAEEPHSAPQPEVESVPGTQDQKVENRSREEPRMAEPAFEGLANTSGIYWILGAVLLVSLPAMALLWHRHLWGRRSDRDSSKQAQDMGQYGTGLQVSAARKAFRAACEANDARRTANTLLDWAQATWATDAPRNLSTLGARLTKGADEINALERHLYAPEAGSWDGTSLLQALQGGLTDASASERRQTAVLEPLYPSRT